MEDRVGGGGGSFVAVRRISHGLDRSNTCNTTSGIFLIVQRHSDRKTISYVSLQELLVKIPICLYWIIFDYFHWYTWRIQLACYYNYLNQTSIRNYFTSICLIVHTRFIIFRSIAFVQSTINLEYAYASPSLTFSLINISRKL